MLVEIVAPRGGEVVDYEHLVAASQQAVSQVRADEARAAGDQDFHTSVSARLRNDAARSWNDCCHSSSESRPQTLRPNRGSWSSFATTLALSTTSRLRAASDESVSTTKSRTEPARPIHSCSGTGKPILSRRSRTASGSTGAKAVFSTCLRWPSLNFTSA